MKAKYLYFDVDNPYLSRIKSYCSFKGMRFLGYLSHLDKIFELLAKHNQCATFFFRPYYTLPTAKIVRQAMECDCEIGLHADKTRLLSEMLQEKRLLESKVKPILGITTHGKGIRFLSPSGEWQHSQEGFLDRCLALNYKYVGTGYWGESFQWYKNKLLLFPKHLTFDKHPKPNFPEQVVLVHPSKVLRNNYLYSKFRLILDKYKFHALKEGLDCTKP